MHRHAITPDNVTIDELIAIPEGEPERLFSPNLSAIKAAYRKLAQRFHPDKNSDERADAVFAHIQKLHERAEDKLERGTWETLGILQLQQKAGRMATIRYLKRHPFELGEMFICDGKLVFVVDKDFGDLFNNGVHAIKGFKYANDKMREQFSFQLPEFVGSFETTDGRNVMVLRRDNDLILLQDLIDHTGGKIQPEHAAWILSRLHNLTCYLQWHGIVHNDISPSTVFVRPKDCITASSEVIKIKDHTIALLGGWWYAVDANRPYVGLPERTLRAIPRGELSVSSPAATVKTDHTLLRIAGREMLGDPTGVRLASDLNVPKPMVDWLTLPGSGDAVRDFDSWQKNILSRSFGERRFVEWNIRPEIVYPQP